MAQLPPSGRPPSAPQRTHWYANEMGCVPLHEPLEAVSVLPCSAVPLIAGSAVFDGGRRRRRDTVTRRDEERTHDEDRNEPRHGESS